MFQVVLFRPEIPPNTGNIIRLCANTGARLHLVEPLGFGLSRREVRRGGLDYTELADVTVHRDFEACRAALGEARLFSIETSGSVTYSEVAFAPGDVFLFGPEHHGLPAGLLETVPAERQLSLPMRPGNRSLNLANAVAVVVYEAWRQNGFGGITPVTPPGQ
ncbi:MAG: tRNA (cytidine(34)-2'-O)-methyltransferase [Proteobacteria bacterium]|nr:tRNA (cytidine(34)-2'-O)-methyltransferase [Pseudomonadota bacterium]